MRTFFKFTLGLGLSTTCILYFFAFFLTGKVEAKGDYEALYAIERQVVTTHVNADGSDVEIEELTKIIRSQLAVIALSQADIPYNSSFQKVDVLEAYTILPSGKKIPVLPNAIRTVDDDISSGASKFSDQKHRIIIFPNVSAGTKVYYKVKTTTHTPLFAKNYQYDLYFSPSREVRHFEWHFSHDPGIPIQVDVKDVKGGRIEDGSKGDIRYVYTYQQLGIKIIEPNQVAYSDFSPHIIFSSFKSQIEVGKAYEDKAKIKAKVTPEVKSLADKITRDIDDPKEQAIALYQWVSSNIRYVAIYLGAGGVVPNDANSIIQNRYGDCKDHDLLLRALLAAKGIESSSALINMGDAFVIPKLGTVSPNNHVITYLPRWNDYVDATQELVPYGLLSKDELDKPVVLTALGKMGRTPKMTAENNKMVTLSKFKIQRNGEILGTSVTSYYGSKEVEARFKYENYVTLTEESTVKNHLASFQQTGTGKFIPSNIYDLNVPFKLQSEFTLDSVMNIPGPGAITIPVGLSPGYFANLQYNKPSEKFYFPYICLSGTIIEESEIIFPKNIKVTHIPVKTEYAESGVLYASTYTLKDNALSVMRILKLNRPSSVCQPNELERWKRIYQVVRKDMLAQILYE